jgi:hypothetical protein
MNFLCIISFCIFASSGSSFLRNFNPWFVYTASFRINFRATKLSASESTKPPEPSHAAQEIPVTAHHDDFYIVECDGSIRPPSPSHGAHLKESAYNHLLDDGEVVVYMSKEGKTFVFDGRSVTEGDPLPGLSPLDSPRLTEIQDSQREQRDDYFSNEKRLGSWDDLEIEVTTTLIPIPEKVLMDDPTAEPFEEESTTTSTAPVSSMQPSPWKLSPEAIAHLQLMQREGCFSGLRRPIGFGVGRLGAPYLSPFPLFAHRLATQPDDHDVDGGYYVPSLDARDERLSDLETAGFLPPLFLMRQSNRPSPTPPIFL